MRALHAHVVLLIILSAQVSATDIEFNKLNQCEDLIALKAKIMQSRMACEAPKSRFEQIGESRIKAGWHGDVCFLDGPVPMLHSFRCIWLPGMKTIGCFRPIENEAVAKFRAEYANRYKARVAQYLVSASHCAASASEATFAGRDIDYPLIFVGAQDLGFRMELSGESAFTKAAITHGVASEDPEIAGPDHSFEFISMWLSQ